MVDVNALAELQTKIGNVITSNGLDVGISQNGDVFRALNKAHSFLGKAKDAYKGEGYSRPQPDRGKEDALQALANLDEAKAAATIAAGSKIILEAIEGLVSELSAVEGLIQQPPAGAGVQGAAALGTGAAKTPRR